MTQKRYTKIPKRQKCVNKEEPYIGGAVDIVDDTLGKPQSQVNQERIEDIAAEVQRAQGAESTLDGKISTEKQRAESVESGLNNRLGTVEQLAEISIGGGDAQIATGADFTNPDATKRAKIATVGAIVDGLNDGVYDVSKRNPTAGPNSDGKFTLDYILSNADTLIPTGWRHGGMTISFVLTSDNKYVQYHYMGTDITGTPNPFLDTANWQGVDDEPTAESDNLVKSGGVYDAIESKSKASLVDKDGFHVVDENLNVGMKYDEDGLDAAKVSSHFVKVLNASGVSVDDVMSSRASLVNENGFFIVDEELNIGVKVDSDGIHAKNILEYEIVED